ncbi:putative major facilitator superfamily transporter protein [Eutypa lata UCREL1]|uniref:Putative major facilitator superfamily transporter protein n=1 Tax=Eutypa lata (strain UCR-EL1) TaxID=1287681 RepID=M7SX33_EUTLA|nr:putative major facilitator superfamily transporter protein [Eutypa lata UCREL1]
MHTWGLNSSFSVFLAYYLREGVFEGATPLVLLAFLSSPIATALAGWKRVGTRLTIFIGSIFVSVSFIGASFATQFWQLLLSQGVSFGVGMGLCFVASAPVPPQWFTKRRSFANAIAAAGSGFGGLCYSLSTNAMITRLGLPWTFRILAIIAFVVNGAASFFIRDRNASIGSVHIAFNWKLFKRVPFQLFEGWLFLSMLGYTILVFSIVDYCRSVGLSASEASLVGALFNMAQGIGRPIIGLSSDKVGRLNISMLSGCIVFAILNGAVAGAMWATLAPVCAEVVGLALIPSAMSLTFLVLVLPATFAEVIGLSLKKSGPRAYLDVQVFTGFMYMGAFAFGWALRAWKVQELEEAHRK